MITQRPEPRTIGEPIEHVYLRRGDRIRFAYDHDADYLVTATDIRSVTLRRLAAEPSTLELARIDCPTARLVDGTRMCDECEQPATTTITWRNQRHLPGSYVGCDDHALDQARRLHRTATSVSVRKVGR